jgi:hypothetical protein
MSRKAKVSGTHMTRIGAVERLYRALQGSPEITKFGFGVIKPAGNGQFRVKVRQDTGCLNLQVRGQTAVQTLRIYTKDFKTTKRSVRLFGHANGWPVTEGP